MGHITLKKDQVQTHSLRRSTTVWVMDGDHCQQLFVSLVASGKIEIGLGCVLSDTVAVLFLIKFFVCISLIDTSSTL